MIVMKHFRFLALLPALIVGAVECRAAAPSAEPAPAKAEYVPQLGEFPPQGAGVYMAGELVAVDHVNRRGALRLTGDGIADRYHAAPSHRFALLPYGTVRYHGAPAELVDIPIGTVLHGYFTLPPEGDTAIPVPEKNNQRYFDPHTHAISLADSFSFFADRGRVWKIVAVDREKRKLKFAVEGPAGGDGWQGVQTFDFDESTRVWKGRELGDPADLAPGQTVQLNFTWSPEWEYGVVHVADVWIDDASRAAAAEAQRRIHVRYQRHRWLAGWVDHVEHQPGGKGIVTVTLFGGIDPSLYEAAKAQAKPGGGASIAAAEPTLRTWWHFHDAKNGPVLDFKETADPPTGSSGLQLRVQIRELLEGYRPGRIVRLRPNGFPNFKLPPEERVKNLDDR
jgi:hypothetical protein